VQSGGLNTIEQGHADIHQPMPGDGRRPVSACPSLVTGIVKLSPVPRRRLPLAFRFLGRRPGERDSAPAVCGAYLHT
jgi:hypothetical protein